MFDTEEQLEAELTRPSRMLVEEVSTWSGERGLVILGAGGKMGSAVATMARRALDQAGKSDHVVTAVSRWTDEKRRISLQNHGVRTVTCDLAEPDQVAALPDADRVIHLVGSKFGTSTHADVAWMTNTVIPSHVARRYTDSAICALSTGNVYPLTDPGLGGPREDDPVGPIGEYAITCRGREQVFVNASRTRGTKITLIRLNYACEARYGVLVDLAKKIIAREPVDLRIGAVNVVWQRYANEVFLRAISCAAAPPFVINVTGPETASVRTLAKDIGARLGIEPTFDGTELPTSLLSNAMLCHESFGYPDRSLGEMIGIVTDWLWVGGGVWDKPTKFERRDGQF